MKIRSLAPPALLVALGAAALLAVALIAGNGDAYVLLGHSLDLGQRDFRVFNNFLNPEANDNTTPDPAFPWRTGAVLAIWKASVEWGSELHGDGTGDPSQPGDLGSGGANFDASFQGVSNDPGPVDGNVHSAISCTGGILAYIEQPAGAGWRIRYCSNWCWDDGPGLTNPPGCYDLQGVATRLYGHVLGLGNSTVPGSTMFPTLTGSGIEARSIEADDIAGIQAIYGAASPAKPHVASVAISGGQVVVRGASFDATSNEVWFTRAGAGGDGTPVSVGNAPSSAGGTQIALSFPSEAGPGDVLVRVPGTAGDALSNAFPAAPCPLPSPYCVGAPNSAGAGARMDSSGSTSVSTNDLVLACNSGPPDQNGIFYYGPGMTQVPLGDGFRCVTGPFCRLPVTSFDANGAASFALDLGAPPNPGCRIEAGSTWFFQFWYRDPAAGGSGFNLSDGLQASFCP